jgi:hypothetical protein
MSTTIGRLEYPLLFLHRADIGGVSNGCDVRVVLESLGYGDAGVLITIGELKVVVPARQLLGAAIMLCEGKNVH